MAIDPKIKKENPDLYRVASGGTEAPFSSVYVHPGHDGMFHCAVCDAPLFASDTQFDSGSGWPSFTDPVVAAAVTLHKDRSNGLERTEVRCANCEAHLGHVFPDGPQQADGTTADRYCINGCSLINKPD